jgi:hypothetical protein
MSVAPFRPWAVVVFLAAFAVVVSSRAEDRTEGPPPGDEKKPADPPADKKTNPLKLPADAVLVVVEQATDALKAMPKFVLLAPEKYQALLDEIERLKAAAKSKPAAPARCRVKGKVEGGLAVLQVQFDFHTDRSDALVALACGPARATGAQLGDGRTPVLSGGDDGFTVQVDKPGDYTLTLDLVLPTAVRAEGRRGVELDLPRAVVTQLELELPADVRGLRLGAKEASETTLVLKGTKVEGPLGAIDKLDLSWQGSLPGGPAATSARGRIKVRVEDGWMTTEAELTLRSQGGPAGQWVVLTPPGAELKAGPSDAGRIASLDQDEKPANESNVWKHTVVLKEPSDKDLVLLATSRKPLPRGGRASVGPFVVPGAARQSGVVFVHDAASDTRVHCQPAAELTRHAPGEGEHDPGLADAFDYVAVPAGDKPLLEVQVESLRGSVKTATNHSLALVHTGGAWGWRGTTTIKASPLLRTGVDHLEVRLPAECQYEGAPAAAAAPSVEWDEKTRIVRFKLPEKPTGEFTLALDWRYAPPVPLKEQGQASVPLPRPLETRDGGGQVEATAPEDAQLLPPDGVDLTVKELHKQAWATPRAPESAPTAWAPFRAEATAQSVVDVTITGPGAGVRQRLTLHYPRAAPPLVSLRVPAAVADALQVVEGGELLAADPGAPGFRTVRPKNGGAADLVLVLQYPLATGGLAKSRRTEEPFDVPLVAAEGTASRGESKARVWCEPGALPLLAPGAWDERNLEIVEGEKRLPALAAASNRMDAPLRLQWRAAEAPPATVQVDRALFRVRLLEGGGAEVRASFRLNQLATSTLDVSLPGPAAALGVEAALGGRAVAWEAVDEEGRRAEGGPIARLRMPAAGLSPGAVLTVSYRSLPGRSDGTFLSAVTPPLLRGDPGRAPARWGVTLPPAWVALAPDGGPGTPWTLGWRGWLPAPRPALTDVDLERWFAGPDASSPSVDAAPAPAAVAWRDAGETLLIAHAPQFPWQLACSLGVFAGGWVLGAQWRRGWSGGRWAAIGFWTATALATGLVAAGWLFQPTLLGAVAYGAVPGAAVLALVLAVQWLVHERYRRRLVYLPAFRRTHPESAGARSVGSSQRPRGAPSTVDAPPAAAGGQP